MPVSVAQLFVYPLKSASGIAVPQLTFDDRGPVDDRRWMLVDESGTFLSQRRFPRMALLQVAITDDAMHVGAPGMPPLVVPRITESCGACRPQTDRVVAQVWNDSVDLIRVDPVMDRWFTSFLDLPCSLVTMSPDTVRRVDPTYAPTPRQVALADGFPVLIIGDASVSELNRRLRDKHASEVDINRFRPNIVVTGAPPHAEDEWLRLEAAGLALDIVKPCARCAIVNVDPSSGRRMLEPLKTLATYRTRGTSAVYFGQNALHDRPGRLDQGDVFSVQERPRA
jgi:uncharacterized protein YcbX